MIISVDGSSPLPPYVQLREQVRTMAASGVLPLGARLPSIRQLAADLDLAPGTVSRAYRELESDGIIISRGRHGSFISKPPEIDPQERSQRLQQEALKFIHIAEQLGATHEQTVAAVHTAHQQRQRL